MRVLGTGEYTAAIHTKGGERIFCDLPSAESGSWDRRVDDTAEAKVVISKKTIGRASRRVGQITPWAHELTVYRSNGGMVWQGPVVDYAENGTSITVLAKDVTAWLGGRVNHAAYDFTGVRSRDLTEIARWLISNGLTPDDPNVAAHALYYPSGVTGERAAAVESVMILAELEELSRNGIDYTTVGRRIVVAGELTPIVPKLARLTDDHFLNELDVQVSGADTVTRWLVEGADGILGTAGGPETGLGLIERLVSEDGVLDVQSARASARARRAVSYVPPIYLRVPDGAQLAPTAPVSIDQLVAGVGVDVAVTRYVRKVQQRQRLIRVTGEWSTSGEKIGITLAPFGAEQ